MKQNISSPLNFRRICLSLSTRIHELGKSISNDMSSISLQMMLYPYKAGHAFSIPTDTSPQELLTIYQLSKKTCANGGAALEIGSYFGASSCCIAAGLVDSGGRLFCVDTWNNETMADGIQDTFMRFLTNTQPFRDYITTIRKDSLTLRFEDVGVAIDFAFIDGDHCFEVVMSDFSKVASWLSPKGIVAFHDYRYFPGVARAVGTALASGEWKTLGNIDNLCWLGRVH